MGRAGTAKQVVRGERMPGVRVASSRCANCILQVYAAKYHGAEVAVKELNASMLRPSTLKEFKSEFMHVRINRRARCSGSRLNGGQVGQSSGEASVALAEQAGS